MINNKMRRLTALGLGAVLVMTSSTMALAADKVSTAKIMVDNQPAVVQGYNIDGSNYYKLRDLAKTLDFGLSWDSASSTISIDSTSS